MGTKMPAYVIPQWQLLKLIVATTRDLGRSGPGEGALHEWQAWCASGNSADACGTVAEEPRKQPTDFFQERAGGVSALQTMWSSAFER